ncbi:hypothetical protein HDU98_007373 [Podochytrium sp. JEL0797]|nr:hypothetical protein HDU98_007373 [Podochytrium sp. JEL0797]
MFFRNARRFGTLGSLGQPASHTHPHLIKPGDITPGISAKEFAERRQRFAALLPAGSKAIVPGFALRYSTGGIFHEFHQQTDLLYLTGLNEPDTCMVLEKDSNGHRFTLFVRPKDKATEIWDGPRCGLEGAVKYFGADSAEPIHRLPQVLDDILNTPLEHSQSCIATDLPLNHPLPPGPNDAAHAASAPSVPAWTPYATLLGYLQNTPSVKPVNLYKIRKLAPILANLRVVKSPAEIAILRQSGRNSGRAHVDTMAATQPGVTESYLQSVMDHGCRKRGSDALAYVPVVAAGRNALILHYVVNRQVVMDGELVLMDAGGEFGHYASDITRTWPVSGTFSEPQKQIYKAVLKANKACIEKCSERANVSLDDLQNLAYEIMKVECSKLFGRRLSYADMNILYPHHVGHYMGLDVHDVQSVPRTTKLVEGMVITIEPGLYVPDDERFPERYRGIGVRIEDDVVIGKEGCLVLTSEAPKEVVDVEAVCQGVVGTGE